MEAYISDFVLADYLLTNFPVGTRVQIEFTGGFYNANFIHGNYTIRSIKTDRVCEEQQVGNVYIEIKSDAEYPQISEVVAIVVHKDVKLRLSRKDGILLSDNTFTTQSIKISKIGPF